MIRQWLRSYQWAFATPAAERVRGMNEGVLKFPMVVVGERVMKNPSLETLEQALAAHGVAPGAPDLPVRAGVP